MSSEQPQVKSQDVERIRDILFGSQMNDYKQRFETIQRDLARLQQDINKLNEQLAEQDSSHGKKLRTLRQEMRQADDELRNETRETAQRLSVEKVDRTALGQLFIEIGNSLAKDKSVGDILIRLMEGQESTNGG